MSKSFTSAEEVIELITRRRRQIMVHSAVYYRLNDNLIPDATFDQFCRELVYLQGTYPAQAREAPFAEEFSGFDGSTGFHLSGNPWAVSTAMQLLHHRNGMNSA